MIARSKDLTLQILSSAVIYWVTGEIRVINKSPNSELGVSLSL